MIWGSLVLFFVVKSGLIGAGWPVLIWFIMLCICFLTVIYNFDIFKASILFVSVAAVFGLGIHLEERMGMEPAGLGRKITWKDWMSPSPRDSISRRPGSSLC